MFDAGSNRGLVSVRCWCPGVLRVNLCLLGIEDSALLFLYLPYFLPFSLRVSPCLLGIEDSAFFISLFTCLSAP